MKLMLILAFIPITLFAIEERPCDNYSSTDLKKYYCNQQGELVREITLWKGINTLHTEFTYSQGNILTYSFYQRSGELTQRSTYNHQQDGSIIKEQFRRKDNRLQFYAKNQYLPAGDNQKLPRFILREWVFSKDYKIDYVDTYDTSMLETITVFHQQDKIPVRRDILGDDGEFEEYYLFYYYNGNVNPHSPSAFERYLPDGTFVGKYNPKSFSMEDLAQEYAPTQDKTLIAIIDSDFDLNHPMIRDKVWINPNEELDGIDNDGNGWIDDINGWNAVTQSGNLAGKIWFAPWGVPAAHGTHVASIATSGRDDVAFVGFCHDFNRPSSVKKIADEINEKSIMFSNMSFSIGSGDSPRIAAILSASPKVVEAVKDLVTNTPNTLHVIAAANGGLDIDLEPTFPASSTDDNTLVVGAIDDDILDPLLLPAYQMTWFSNFGVESVDILAPGASLLGAVSGGGMSTYSGTSMATPYVLNHAVLEVHKTNPALSIYQIKEVVMKSVYIRDLNNPFPVRSGGIIYPDRARAMALLLKENSNLSITEAAIKARESEVLLLAGEDKSDSYYLQLKEFWSVRGI